MYVHHEPLVLRDGAAFGGEREDSTGFATAGDVGKSPRQEDRHAGGEGVAMSWGLGALSWLEFQAARSFVGQIARAPGAHGGRQ